MNTDADRAKAIVIAFDFPTTAEEYTIAVLKAHREEAYALGRIEGAKAMQEAAISQCRRSMFLEQARRLIRALDPEAIAKGKP